MTSRPELVQLKQHIASVPGWLTDEEAEALYDLARACTGKGVIVEIGSWKGKSTICLASGSRAGNGVRVYAIDPHASYRFGEFKANVERAGVADLVTPIASRSQEKAASFHEPIELLFVDGAHEYELVKADLELWLPKLVEGGTLAMHDTTWTDGPRRAASERVYRSTDFRGHRFVIGSLTVAQKVARNSWRDRLRSRYVLAVKTLFGGATALLKKRRHLLPQRVEVAGRRLWRAIQ